MFEVTTNEGKFVTDASESVLREAMMQYIKAKRVKGYSLPRITFCYREVRFLAHQSLRTLAPSGKVVAY